MNKTLKVILVISVIFNMIFFISTLVIGVEVWRFANDWDTYFWKKGEHEDKKRPKYHIDHKRGFSARKKHRGMFSFFKNNQEIKENFRQIKEVKNEIKAIVREDPLDMNRLEESLSQLEGSIIDITKITHKELINFLKDLDKEEREKVINSFFHKKVFN